MSALRGFAATTNTKAPLLCGALLGLGLLSGCTSNLQGDTYSRNEARSVQQLRIAVVEDVRMVVIEGSKSGVGGLAGAAIGGIAGSSVGGGKGSTIAAIAGAVGGGVLGGKAEEAATRVQGVEIVVRYQDSNNLAAVVQQYDPKEDFQPGDVVRVMTVNGTSRVAQ
jgi:outer membrane lipoprotein SlyB